MAKRKKRKHRNSIIAAIAQNDPTRLKLRVVFSEKGKGRKDRPRVKKISDDELFDCAA